MEKGQLFGVVLFVIPLKFIAIDGDIVFAQDAQGFCMPLIPKPAKLCWEKQLPVNGLPALIDGLVADEGVVYAGTGKGLCAFEARTGKQLWRNEGWGQGEGNYEYADFGEWFADWFCTVECTYGNDAQTGEKLWAASDNGLRNRGHLLPCMVLCCILFRINLSLY